MMRNGFLFALLLMLFLGCMSERVSYRYGDGMPYCPMSTEAVKNKVCLSSIRFIDEKETRLHCHHALQVDEPSVSDVVSQAPDVLTDRPSLNGMSIDVSVRFHKVTEDMCLLDHVTSFIPILPFISHFKREMDIEIRESGCRELLSSSDLTGRHSMKMSCLLFLGAIPFNRLDGYQENILDYELEFEKKR